MFLVLVFGLCRLRRFGLIRVYCCYCRFVGLVLLGFGVVSGSGTCCLIVLLGTTFYCWGWHLLA